jgi:2-amino-4-hydroxy-6-hydroxymethyldihydropteridine diphosphokinase
MTPAWVALGSNLGDRGETLSRAFRWLSSLPETELVARSRLHRTAPVGPPQPDYLNAVALLETRLPPLALLTALQRLEAAAARRRDLRWGPRTLDLDLLLFGPRGAHRLAHPRLELPHPRLHERTFVLTPLCELSPDLELTTGLTVKAQLDALRA